MVRNVRKPNNSKLDRKKVQILNGFGFRAFGIRAPNVVMKYASLGYFWLKNLVLFWKINVRKTPSVNHQWNASKMHTPGTFYLPPKVISFNLNNNYLFTPQTYPKYKILLFYSLPKSHVQWLILNKSKIKTFCIKSAIITVTKRINVNTICQFIFIKVHIYHIWDHSSRRMGRGAFILLSRAY